AIRLHDECDRLLGRGAGGLHTDRGAEDARKEERVPGAPGEEPPTLDLDGVRGDELGDREAPETYDAAGRAAEHARPRSKEVLGQLDALACPFGDLMRRSGGAF